MSNGHRRLSRAAARPTRPHQRRSGASRIRGRLVVHVLEPLTPNGRNGTSRTIGGLSRVRSGRGAVPARASEPRLPIRRIISTSCVATRTVVPRMLISAKSRMISSARTGSRLPVGSSASSSVGSLTMRARDGHALLLAAGELLRVGVHAGGGGRRASTRGRRAVFARPRGEPEHVLHERDVLEDGLSPMSLKS